MKRKGQGNEYTLTDCPLCNARIQKSQDKRSNLRTKLSRVKELSQHDMQRQSTGFEIWYRSVTNT